MSAKFLALASAIAAATAFTSLAEAGGGVRLQFGGPIGAFTATPSRGGSGYAAKDHGQSRKAARKKTPSQDVVRRTPSTGSSKVAKKPDTKDEAETTGSSAAAVTGSTALIQGSTQPAASETATDTNADVPGSGTGEDVAVQSSPEPAQDAAGASVADEPKAEEPEAEDTKAESETVDESKVETTSGEAATDEEVGCKKFIPAIGLTVTVGCKE